MPKLVSNATRKMFLPSTEGLAEEDKAWVEVKTRLDGGDMLRASTNGVDNIERTIAALATYIVSWNYTDDNDEIEPITFESVRRLEIEDFQALVLDMNAAQKSVKTSVEGEQKKTSSSTLTPSIPGVSQT